MTTASDDDLPHLIPCAICGKNWPCEHRAAAKRFSVLHLEDDQAVAGFVARAVGEVFPGACGDVFMRVSDAVATLSAVPNHYDLIISDFNVLGPETGGDFLAWVKLHQPHMVERFVFFTGNSDVRLLHPKVIDKGISVASFVHQLHLLVTP